MEKVVRFYALECIAKFQHLFVIETWNQKQNLNLARSEKQQNSKREIEFLRLARVRIWTEAINESCSLINFLATREVSGPLD